MPTVGIVRGKYIELEQPLDLPEGSRVEVEVRPLPPLWGLFADKADMLDEIERETYHRRQSDLWRTPEESYRNI